MVKNIAIFSLLLLSLFAAEPVFACSCAPPPPPQEAAQQAAAVFTGTVLEVTPTGTEPTSKRQVRIRVERVWKGTQCGEVTIVTPLDEAACGYNFQVGESYLIYATKEKGKLSTNLCTRTTPTSQAGEDLAALGEPSQVC